MPHQVSALCLQALESIPAAAVKACVPHCLHLVHLAYQLATKTESGHASGPPSSNLGSKQDSEFMLAFYLVPQNKAVYNFLCLAKKLDDHL